MTLQWHLLTAAGQVNMRALHCRPAGPSFSDVQTAITCHSVQPWLA